MSAHNSNFVRILLNAYSFRDVFSGYESIFPSFPVFFENKNSCQIDPYQLLILEVILQAARKDVERERRTGERFLRCCMKRRRVSS